MARDDSRHPDFNKDILLWVLHKECIIFVKPPGDWGELYFRDYLRTHPDVARQYGVLKEKLKGQFEHNRDAYTAAKSDFVQKYMQLAREEFQEKYIPKV
jgi:hypothetical protein